MNDEQSKDIAWGAGLGIVFGAVLGNVVFGLVLGAALGLSVNVCQSADLIQYTGATVVLDILPGHAAAAP